MLLDVMKANKIILFTPMIGQYLYHGLRLKAVYQLAKYEKGKPFSQFPQEVTNPRCEANKNPLKKQLGDVAKLKGKIIAFLEK